MTRPRWRISARSSSSRAAQPASACGRTRGSRIATRSGAPAPRSMPGWMLMGRASYRLPVPPSTPATRLRRLDHRALSVAAGAGLGVAGLLAAGLAVLAAVFFAVSAAAAEVERDARVVLDAGLAAAFFAVSGAAAAGFVAGLEAAGFFVVSAAAVVGRVV